MARPDIKGMNLRQLLDLRDRVDEAIAEAEVAEREETKRVLADMAEKRGFSVNDLFGGRKGKGKASVAKYRNPDNPSETWTGRGRKPNWLVSALKKPGVKIEQFEL